VLIPVAFILIVLRLVTLVTTFDEAQDGERTQQTPAIHTLAHEKSQDLALLAAPSGVVAAVLLDVFFLYRLFYHDISFQRLLLFSLVGVDRKDDLHRA
jgi:hypothetical protein